MKNILGVFLASNLKPNGLDLLGQIENSLSLEVIYSTYVCALYSTPLHMQKRNQEQRYRMRHISATILKTALKPSFSSLSAIIRYKCRSMCDQQVHKFSAQYLSCKVHNKNFSWWYPKKVARNSAIKILKIISTCATLSLLDCQRDSSFLIN